MSATSAVSDLLAKTETRTQIAVFVATLFASYQLISFVRRKRYNLPPGPSGLPIVGYLPFFGASPPEKFEQLTKKYGDVFSISMGSFPAIVLNGHKAIKEALVTKGDDFSGRPAFTSAKILNDGRNFGFSLFGPRWKAHRKIVSNVLFTFSNARNNPIEDIIRTEAEHCIQSMLSHKKEPQNPKEELLLCANSMVYQLCYGYDRNVREDKVFIDNIKNSLDFVEFVRAGNPVDVMPWLRYVIPGQLKKFVKLISTAVELRNIEVMDHEKDYDENSLRDITDGFIHAGNNLNDQEKALGLDKTCIIESIDAVLGAGGNTIASTLQWMVCYMAKFEEIQQKLFQQIDEVVGTNRPVTLADRTALPLVEATVYEALRHSRSVPFALPHAATCDTTVFGYDIPEGTVVLVNLASIQFEKELWGDPDNFRPDRFVTADGTIDRALAEQVGAFSMGRRRCVGEFLARMELFLFFATLLQQVRIYKPPGSAPYTFGSTYALAREIDDYEVCVEARK